MRISCGFCAKSFDLSQLETLTDRRVLFNAVMAFFGFHRYNGDCIFKSCSLGDTAHGYDKHPLSA